MTSFARLLPTAALLLVAAIPVHGQEPPRPVPVPYGKAPSPGTARQNSPLNRSQHLQQAIEHLRAADFPTEADHLERLARELRNSQRTELDRKRRELMSLQAEIAALERQLGLADQYSIRCIIGDVPVTKLRKLGMDLDWSAPEPRILETTSFEEILHGLLAQDLVKLLAEPQLVTLAGEPAAIHSGGEFPIPHVHQASGETGVTWRTFGVSLVATVTPLEGEMIQLHAVPEISTRNFENVVTADDGTRIPGVNVRRMQTNVRMKLGQTILLGGLTSSSDEDGERSEILHFFAVTPSRVSFPTDDPATLPPAPPRTSP